MRFTNIVPTVWVYTACMLMAVASRASDTRCVMYLTGQHNVVPSDTKLTSEISHVILAFVRSDVFNAPQPPREYPLFTTVEEVRPQFKPGTKVMVAIGGWGDSAGFEAAAKNSESRKHWASQIRAMVNVTGADGVDIDWEYPGGNRDDYKIIPNERRKWEIEAFVALLGEVRNAIGPNKLLSIAVPGLKRDLMAFTDTTLPEIIKSVDFINLMTYDLLNRRDTMVKHHSGVADSRESAKTYIERGTPAGMLNLGLGYYVKWAKTTDCDPHQLLKCPTQLLEDPKNGDDLGRTAAFSWHDQVPVEFEASFSRARVEGKYFDDGSFGYWDANGHIWWTFDTPASIDRKFKDVIRPEGLGGVFAWGLGEDAPEFEHLEATIEGVRQMRGRRNETGNEDERDEL